MKAPQVSPGSDIIRHISNKQYSSKPGQSTLSDFLH